jgi:hypothetical protein
MRKLTPFIYLKWPFKSGKKNFILKWAYLVVFSPEMKCLRLQIALKNALIAAISIS